jgi:hypothetical protein
LQLEHPEATSQIVCPTSPQQLPKLLAQLLHATSQWVVDES